MNIPFFFLLISSALGVAMDVMFKIKALRVKFPQLPPGQIAKTFFASEWDTLIISGLVAFVLQFAYVITKYNEVKFPGWFEDWAIYVLFFVVNYSGQRIAYKFLTTSEKRLIDEIDKRNNV